MYWGICGSVGRYSLWYMVDGIVRLIFQVRFRGSSCRPWAGTFSFLFHGKLLSHEIKTLREDCTAAERKMPPMRPAAGGESCKTGFLLMGNCVPVCSQKIHGQFLGKMIYWYQTSQEWVSKERNAKDEAKDCKPCFNFYHALLRRMPVKAER